MDLSRKLYRDARGLLPGGVSSPVRAYSPYPRFISRGQGAHVWDVEGRDYVDLCLGYGPLLNGHAYPPVVEAVQRQAALGSLFGAPVELEVRVARRLRSLFPSMERLRFVSTGGEGASALVRLARGYTKAPGVVMMDGGFHGSVDPLLFRTGRAGRGLPSSAGVVPSRQAPTYVVPFNQADALAAVLSERKDVGLVLMEPVLGNVGTILPEPGYLQKVRRMTREEGVLLAFDEVITGLRVAPGGAQERFGVSPDLTLLGKAIGGGLPLAAYGGRRDILSQVAPDGPVYQSGTYSGNPLSLAAAEATLQHVSAFALARVETETQRLVEAISGLFRRAKRPVSLPTVGSLFSLFLTEGPVRDAATAREVASAEHRRLLRALLERGLFVPQSPFETFFLSTRHGPQERRQVLAAFSRALEERPSKR
jgi:glutamate-1-semialdehyde 2,1-aminomutase